jgi:hypothetical protein
VSAGRARAVALALSVACGAAAPSATACEPAYCVPWDRAAAATPSRLVYAAGAEDAYDRTQAWVETRGIALVISPRGDRLVGTRLGSSTDETGLSVFRRSQRGGGWVVSPSSPALTPGPVVSVPVAEIEDVRSRDQVQVLRAPGLPTLVVAQRCLSSGAATTWCAVVLAQGASRQLLYAAPERSAAGMESTGFPLMYAGDLNRDGVLDLIFGVSWRGGAPCAGAELYLSQRHGERVAWMRAAEDVACM